MVLAFELLIFIINYSLQGVNRLLGCLVQLKCFFLVVLLLILLVADEATSIVS